MTRFLKINDSELVNLDNVARVHFCKGNERQDAELTFFFCFGQSDGTPTRYPISGDEAERVWRSIISAAAV